MVGGGCGGVGGEGLITDGCTAGGMDTGAGPGELLGRAVGGGWGGGPLVLDTLVYRALGAGASFGWGGGLPTAICSSAPGGTYARPPVASPVCVC
ncbi:unnamed protein product [Dicrocoelium dendriticum]|nr:unnamed protein product [Dicrocoelium dendriticum]